MTRALSQDLRSRVIAVVDAGVSCNAAAARFGVAVSTACAGFVRGVRRVVRRPCRKVVICGPGASRRIGT